MVKNKKNTCNKHFFFPFFANSLAETLSHQKEIEPFICQFFSIFIMTFSQQVDDNRIGLPNKELRLLTEVRFIQPWHVHLFPSQLRFLFSHEINGLWNDVSTFTSTWKFLSFFVWTLLWYLPCWLFFNVLINSYTFRYFVRSSKLKKNVWWVS